jgi:hypothetical protein
MKLTIGFFDPLRAPFGRRPIEGPPLFDDIVESPDDLLHRDWYTLVSWVAQVVSAPHTCRVMSMGKDHVDIVHSESLQSFFCSFNNTGTNPE